MKIIYNDVSHIGLVRDTNEDCHAVIPSHGLIIVADGMGGHEAGELASETTVRAIQENLVCSQPINPNLLVHAIQKANHAVLNLQESLRIKGKIGATVVVGLFHENSLYYASIGDSRIYLFRDNQFKQLTHDDSLLNELIDQGLLDQNNVHNFQQKNVITRAVGIENDIEIQIDHRNVFAGDTFLFCTDGLSDYVDEESIVDILSEEEDLSTKRDSLLEASLNNGGKDNITFVLAYVATCDSHPKESIVSRCIKWISRTIVKKE